MGGLKMDVPSKEKNISKIIYIELDGKIIYTQVKVVKVVKVV